jgi:parvulin-like peptidyl-prolyl isomerase
MTPLRWPAAVLALAALTGPLHAEIVEQVLVKVNGEILTLSEFEQRQVAALRESPELARVSPDSPQLAQAIAETAPRLILSAVDELLWLQRARELGWALTDERYGLILGDIRKSNNLEDEAAFKSALAAEGMSERQLRSSIERNVLIQQLQRQEVLDKIDVTDGELNQYYENNRSQFTTPAEVTLREILIPVPTTEKGVNVAASDAAQAQAEAIRKRLVAGEPFPRLAAEVSASASKANGGLMDPIRLDDMAPTFQDLLSKMNVGDITDVVPTTAGFLILKLESRSETKIQTLEEARDAVSRRVAEQKADRELLRYLEQLRGQATITWRHEELRKAYEQALAERRKQLGLAVPVGQASAQP